MAERIPATVPADPRVTVFALGGTIAMTPAVGGGVVPALSPDELINAVPGLADTGIDIDMVELRRLPGASLDVTDLVALAEAIDAALDAGSHGVVITQGTDTIEETAYFLDLWHNRPAPVVITGAMRHPGMAGADGPANLLAAIHTAVSPHAHGQGVLVVLADEIHAARRVRKTHSTTVAAFGSTNGGPLGYLAEGRAYFLNRLVGRFSVPRPVRHRPQPRVGLATITLGHDADMLAVMLGRLDGLVVAGMGAGHVPSGIVDILGGTAGRIPTVLASRTGAGPTLRETYGFDGSERDLIARGLIPAGFLDPLHARILLHTCLATDADDTTIRAAFVAAGYNDPASWPWPHPTINNSEVAHAQP